MTIEQATSEALERSTDRFYGKYRGIVKTNVDPSNLGRLKASVPEVLGQTPTGWALPCAPYAGAGVGFFAIPPIGAGVWIEFEAGDASRPVWSGTWWSNSEVPSDEKGAPAKQPTKILRTEFGLLIALNDSAQTIAISDSNGVNLLTIKVQQSTSELRAGAKVLLEAPLIYHGQNAAHPAVLGDLLLTYLTQLTTTFNTHLHPGELAAGFIPVTPMIPVPPATPPTPSLLSTKVLVE